MAWKQSRWGGSKGLGHCLPPKQCSREPGATPVKPQSTSREAVSGDTRLRVVCVSGSHEGHTLMQCQDQTRLSSFHQATQLLTHSQVGWAGKPLHQQWPKRQQVLDNRQAAPTLPENCLKPTRVSPGSPFKEEESPLRFRAPRLGFTFSNGYRKKIKTSVRMDVWPIIGPKPNYTQLCNYL